MISGASRGVSQWRELAASLRHSPGLGRLLAVRLASQLTDGIFQAALIGGVLFNPERHADPVAAAAGFAVLLLPYSLIGPFAGALLDHWDRRSVLVFANLLRGLLVGVVAVAVAGGAPDVVVLIGALAVTGASRFVASGLSAALPHVAKHEVIVATNAVVTTLGGAMLSVGAVVALLAHLLLGPGNTGSAVTMVVGVIFAAVASGIARAFAPRALGPTIRDGSSRSAVHAVAVGLAHGVRAVARRPSVAAALSAIGAHRLVFGINTLVLFVFARHSGHGDGLDEVSLVLGFTAGGAFLAALVTPTTVDRFGRRATLLGALAVGVLGELALLAFAVPLFCAGALLLGLIGQTAKLCGDTAMQIDIGDDARGQVFSVQDAVFNVAYVVAMLVAAAVIAPNGRSDVLIILGVLVYLAGIVVVVVLHPRGPSRRHRRPNSGEPSGYAASARPSHRRPNSGEPSGYAASARPSPSESTSTESGSPSPSSST